MMNLTDILTDVAAVAANPVLGLAKVAIDAVPEIAGWIGGDDAQDAAEKVANVVKAVTGSDDPAQAAEKLADPSMVLQLRMQAQQFSHEENMQQMQNTIEELKEQLKDTQDARARDVEYIRAGKTNDRANMMVIMDVVGLCVCILILLGMVVAKAVYKVDGMNEFIVLLGSLASYFGLSLRDAHQFEFGSSRGSQQKDQLLALSTPTQDSVKLLTYQGRK